MDSERFPPVTVSLDSQPTDVPFRLGVEVRNGFTPEEPARLRISFENCSEREQRVGGGDIFPVSNIWNDDAHLVLIPTDESIQKFAFGPEKRIIPDQPTDGCWQTNLVHLIVKSVLRWRTLTSGETISTEYAVLHYPEREIMEATTDLWYGSASERDGCLPAGDYRFEQDFQRWTVREFPDSEDSAEIDRLAEYISEKGVPMSGFNWGFTLTLGE
jgi:hypothetical protein